MACSSPQSTLPMGNPQPGTKFDYKLAWLKRLNAHAAELYATGAPAVLAGDYNVVPTDLDIYPTKSWDRNALLQPESRAAYQRLLAQGWTDAIRALHPKEPMYTFWDYMRNRWERDGGLRLDHILLSSTLTERLQSAGVDRQTRGMADASVVTLTLVALWRPFPECRGRILSKQRASDGHCDDRDIREWRLRVQPHS
jgi:exodeoxyribonuclease III